MAKGGHMADLRDIPEIYPNEVTLKHQGQRYDVSLAVVKWLEAHKIMNIEDFHLEMNFSEDKIAVLFKKKKNAKIFKKNKKTIRESVN
jgi:hypothetical protein